MHDYLYMKMKYPSTNNIIYEINFQNINLAIYSVATLIDDDATA